MYLEKKNKNPFSLKLLLSEILLEQQEKKLRYLASLLWTGYPGAGKW